MTHDEETCSVQVIEFCRTHFRKLGAVELAKIGAQPDDIAIAACYSAFDLSAAHKGNPIEGIEFARTALDVIERSLLAGETPQ